MSRRSFTSAGATVLAFFALAATSWAYLGSIGAGAGAGDAAVSRVVTIAAGTPPNDTLLPTGAATGTLSVSIANATGSPLRVDSLVLDTTLGSGGYSADAAACKVSYATQSVGRTIDAGTTEQVSLQNAVTMGTDAPSSCQDKTFSIYLKTP